MEFLKFHIAQVSNYVARKVSRLNFCPQIRIISSKRWASKTKTTPIKYNKIIISIISFCVSQSLIIMILMIRLLILMSKYNSIMRLKRHLGEKTILRLCISFLNVIVQSILLLKPKVINIFSNNFITVCIISKHFA